MYTTIKLVFLTAICSAYSLLHGFHIEIEVNLPLKHFRYFLPSFEDKGIRGAL